MKVAIAWNGLPYYGARLMRPVVEKLGAEIAVLGTPGPQSRQEIEDTLGAPVSLIALTERICWKQLGMQVPELFIHSGWSYPSFCSLAREVKMRGGIVASMIDNPRKHNLRQAMGRYAFRLLYRRNIDIAFVAGESGASLMRYFGMPEDSVYSGMLGADPEVYCQGPPLAERNYDFLFVGNYIPLKGIAGLIRAVKELRKAGRRFCIAAIGDGPMRGDLESAGIETLSFAQADTVAKMMRDARFLVLPSTQDHWGLVVHEAALSGCGLILSSGVGARFDL